MSRRQLKRDNAHLAKELAKSKLKLKKRQLRAKELAERYLAVILDVDDQTHQRGN